MSIKESYFKCIFKMHLIHDVISMNFSRYFRTLNQLSELKTLVVGIRILSGNFNGKRIKFNWN